MGKKGEIVERFDRKTFLSDEALMNLANSYARPKRVAGRPSKVEETGLVDGNTHLGLSKGFSKHQTDTFQKSIGDFKKDLVRSCAKRDSIKSQDRANIDFIEEFCENKDENLYNMNKKEIEEMEKAKKAISKYRPVEDIELMTEQSYHMLLDSAITSAIISIIDLAKNSSKESTRLNASKYILDRKFGTPNNQTSDEADIFASLPQIIITEPVLEEIKHGNAKK